MSKIQGGLLGGIDAKSLRRGEFFGIAGLTVFVLAFAAVGFWRGMGDIWVHINRLDGENIAILLALSSVNYFMRIWRWLIFSDAVGIRMSRLRAGLFYIAGLALTLTPGKMGETLRLWLLWRSEQIPIERSAGILIADRLSDASAVLIICLLGLVGSHGNGWGAAVAAVLVVALNVVFLKPNLLNRLVGRLYEALGRGGRIFARIRTALRHMKPITGWQVYGGTLVISMTGWLAEVGALYYLIETMGGDITLLDAAFIFTFSMLVGTLLLLPGGLGGAEATMIGLLIAFRVPTDIAIAGTALIRLTTLWFAVVLGCVALPISMHIVKRAERGIAAPKASPEVDIKIPG